MMGSLIWPVIISTMTIYSTKRPCYKRRTSSTLKSRWQWASVISPLPRLTCPSSRDNLYLHHCSIYTCCSPQKCLKQPRLSSNFDNLIWTYIRMNRLVRKVRLPIIRLSSETSRAPSYYDRFINYAPPGKDLFFWKSFNFLKIKIQSRHKSQAHYAPRSMKRLEKMNRILQFYRFLINLKNMF